MNNGPGGETLYNRIVLPREWPPRTLDPASREPVDIPYLSSPPEVIPIDVGRQLFVDDFLVDETTLRRSFHLAKKYDQNPILEPTTDLEMNGGYKPVAVPFSDAVLYDGKDELFKMWYQAGWYLLGKTRLGCGTRNQLCGRSPPRFGSGHGSCMARLPCGKTERTVQDVFVRPHHE